MLEMGRAVVVDKIAPGDCGSKSTALVRCCGCHRSAEVVSGWSGGDTTAAMVMASPRGDSGGRLILRATTSESREMVEATCDQMVSGYGET